MEKVAFYPQNGVCGPPPGIPAAQADASRQPVVLNLNQIMHLSLRFYYRVAMGVMGTSTPGRLNTELRDGRAMWSTGIRESFWKCSGQVVGFKARPWLSLLFRKPLVREVYERFNILWKPLSAMFQHIPRSSRLGRVFSPLLDS